MTTATVTTPPGQETAQFSRTAPVQTDPVVDTATAVYPGLTSPQERPSSISTQTGQTLPLSTWSTPTSPARPTGLGPVTGLDKWEGKILEMDGDTFTAELYPIGREGMPITADFSLELLGSDATNVVPGDVFYLSVRTVKGPGRRPARTESLRLRRLGRITPEEVQAVYTKADVLMEHLEQLFD
jgi:hypothetical protein